jgi:hypothetical protein
VAPSCWFACVASAGARSSACVLPPAMRASGHPSVCILFFLPPRMCVRLYVSAGAPTGPRVRWYRSRQRSGRTGRAMAFRAIFKSSTNACRVSCVEFCSTSNSNRAVGTRRRGFCYTSNGGVVVVPRRNRCARARI